MLEPSRPNEPSGPDVVVGVPAEPDRVAASEAALALESGLKEARAIRERLATLKPKPTEKQQPAGPGGQR